MATIQANIRWSDNTAELAQNLQHGIGLLDVMKQRVDRTAESLGGAGLFRAANNAAAAVEQLGGVTKLTAAEQDRHTAFLERAIEKYRVMGQVVPTVILDQAAALKKTEDHTNKWTEALKLNAPLLSGMVGHITENVHALGALGLAVGGAFVAYELLHKGMEFLEGIGERAKQWRNLSTETGIGTERLQAMAVATKEFGVDGEQLARGIFQLSRRIAGDDSSAGAALESLGLSMRTLRNQKPEDLFLTVLRAANQVPDPLKRSALEAQLFGARIAQALLAIGPEFEHLSNEALHSSQIMSDDAVQGAAKFTDALEKLSNSAKAMSGEWLAGPMEGIAKFLDFMRSGHVMAQLKLLGKEMVGVMPTPEQFAAAGMGAAAQGAAGAHEAEAGAHGLTDALAALRGELVPVTAAQDRWLRSLAAIGPEFLTTQRMMNAPAGADGAPLSEKQLAIWKQSLQLQQELATARSTAAVANAVADAAETGGLQHAVSTRIAALDLEHGARLSAIGRELASDTKRHTDLLAEHMVYVAKRRLLVADGDAQVAEIVRTSDEEIAKIEAANHAQSLDQQIAAIDREVYQKQQGVLAKVGYTAEEWKGEYAQYLLGQAKIEALTDAYHKRQIDAETKLRGEIAGLRLQSDQAGLARTLAGLSAKEAAEIAALDRELLRESDRLTRAGLISQKFGVERHNAQLDHERALAKDLLGVEQQIEDQTINLALTGMQAELAINDTKRRRRLEQLHLEGKDVGQAGQALVEAETQLFTVQAQTILAKHDQVFQAVRTFQEDVQEGWQRTFADTLAKTDRFKDAFVAVFDELQLNLKRIFAAIVANAMGVVLQPLTQALAQTSGTMAGLLKGVGPTGAGLLGGGAASVLTPSAAALTASATALDTSAAGLLPPASALTVSAGSLGASAAALTSAASVLAASSASGGGGLGGLIGDGLKALFGGPTVSPMSGAEIGGAVDPWASFPTDENVSVTAAMPPDVLASSQVGPMFSSLPAAPTGADLSSAASRGGAGLGTLVGGGLMAGMGLAQMIHSTSAGGDILGGVETGAGIGTMIAPGIGTLIGAGVGALAGGIRALFRLGGPSDEELKARDLVHQYVAGIQSHLTAAERVEAGGVDWKMTGVVVRDAYLRAGRTEADAMQALDRLYAATRDHDRPLAKVQQAEDEIDWTMALGRPLAPSMTMANGAVIKGAASGIYASGTAGVATWFGEGGRPEVGGPAQFFKNIFTELGVGSQASAAGGSDTIEIHNHFSQPVDAQTIETVVLPILIRQINGNTRHARTNLRAALGTV